MERQNKGRVTKRQIRNIPESYLIIRILSIILVFAVLDINFINVWSLNIFFLLVIVIVYSIFIFYPKKNMTAIIDIVKFALGVVSLFVGISLFVFVAKSTIINDFPFNVGVLISIYASFWAVVGWFLIVKSQYTKIRSRFIQIDKKF
jgi:hypothetical protein